jgi:hypothetical protein
MAANSSVYSSNTIQAYNNSKDEILTLLPLNLAEYNGNMKSLFFLDEVKTLKDKNGRDVFIGLVKEQDDVNMYPNKEMRNPNRLGKGRLLYKDSQGNITNYIICNDGGLNTYGRAYINEVADNQPCNRVYVTMTGRSAYHSASGRCGVRYVLRNTSLQEVGSGEWPLFTSLPAKEQMTDTFYIEDIDARAGHQMELTPYIINDEGEKSYFTHTVTLKEGVYSLEARPITAHNVRPESAFQRVYMNSEAWVYMGTLVRNELGIRFPKPVVMYADEKMTTPIAAGLWQVRYNSYNGGASVPDAPPLAPGFEYTENSLALYTGDKAVVSVDADGIPTQFVIGTWSDVDMSLYGSYKIVVDFATISVIGVTTQVVSNPNPLRPIYIFFTCRVSGGISKVTSMAFNYDPSLSRPIIPATSWSPDAFGLRDTFTAGTTYEIELFASLNSDLSNAVEIDSIKGTI